MNSNPPRRPVKTVNTAAEIVDVLVESDELTLTEIATDVGIAESTAHRHLSTLVDNGFLVRNGTRYRLSFRFLDLGTRLQHNHPLYAAGREYIDELADETGERVWLSTIENEYSVSLYWASDRNPLQQHSRIGTRLPLHVSAVGKAMLATLPEDLLEEILEQPLVSRTEATITNETELRDELHDIRERGYAISTGETAEGMEAVAVAVSDEKADILGGISIGCSASRMTESLREEFAFTLWETADEMAIRTRFL